MAAAAGTVSATERLRNRLLVAALAIAATLGDQVSEAASGARVESPSAPMLDGTPTVVAGAALSPCIRLEGSEAMRLLNVEDFSAELRGGPATARVTYQRGLETIEEELFYWRVPSPRVPAVGQLASLEVHALSHGGLAISATLAHRTDRTLDQVDHASLTLTIIDQAVGQSARLTTWGGWIAGQDGAMEFATLSTAVDCVSLTDFTGEVPPGAPLVGALTGGDPSASSALIWVLQGQAQDGSFTFSATGPLEAAAEAIEDVKAAVVAAGWPMGDVDGPEIGQDCHIPGGDEPVPPCVWTVQPAPANPPPQKMVGGGSLSTPGWYGTWSQNGVAQISGARISKSQEQRATLWGLLFTSWNPAPTFRRSWDGQLLIDRVGECGECPCEVIVLASPRAELEGLLDAIASVTAKLVASVTVGSATSKATLTCQKLFGTAGQLQLGADDLSLTVQLGEDGFLAISEEAGPEPGPLNATLGCGGMILVSTSFSASGTTLLSLSTDFPWLPEAALHILGQARLGLSIQPAPGSEGECGGPALPMPWQWEPPQL